MNKTTKKEIGDEAKLKAAIDELTGNEQRCFVEEIDIKLAKPSVQWSKEMKYSESHMRRILEKAAQRPWGDRECLEYKVGRFYANCMDADRADTDLRRSPAAANRSAAVRQRGR